VVAHLRVVAYGVGLVGSTTAIGAAAGALGTVLRRVTPIGSGAGYVWIMGVGLLTLACSLHEAAIVRLPLPQVRWQVPASWIRYGRVAQSFLYGVVLGAEVFTLIPYAASYSLVLLEATLGLRGGAVLGAVYGITRALSVVGGVVVSHHRRDVVPVMALVMWTGSANT